MLFERVECYVCRLRKAILVSCTNRLTKRTIDDMILLLHFRMVDLLEA